MFVMGLVFVLLYIFYDFYMIGNIDSLIKIYVCSLNKVSCCYDCKLLWLNIFI